MRNFQSFKTFNNLINFVPIVTLPNVTNFRLILTLYNLINFRQFNMVNHLLNKEGTKGGRSSNSSRKFPAIPEDSQVFRGRGKLQGRIELLRKIQIDWYQLVLQKQSNILYRSLSPLSRDTPETQS